MWLRRAVLLRDRPADGAAWVCKFMRGLAVFGAGCALAYGGLGCETGLGANSD